MKKGSHFFWDPEPLHISGRRCSIPCLPMSCTSINRRELAWGWRHSPISVALFEAGPSFVSQPRACDQMVGFLIRLCDAVWGRGAKRGNTFLASIRAAPPPSVTCRASPVSAGEKRFRCCWDRGWEEPQEASGLTTAGAPEVPSVIREWLCVDPGGGPWWATAL